MAPPYSKSRVDRAGRFFADQVSLVVKDPDYLEQSAPIRQIREAVDVIDWWRDEHAKPLSRVAANLRYYAAKEGDPVVSQRLKRTPTIAGKLLREPSMKLSRMADIGGVRALAPSQDAAYRIATSLRRNWTITRMRDYVTEPKDDGYRAIHLINRHRGRLIEIQIRTPSQDAWANSVEKVSRTFPGLKFGQGPLPLRAFFHYMAETLAQLDQGSLSLEEVNGLVEKRASETVKLIEDAQ